MFVRVSTASCTRDSHSSLTSGVCVEFLCLSSTGAFLLVLVPSLFLLWSFVGIFL